MKTIKIVLVASALSLGLVSCMEGTEEVKTNEDKLEAPTDLTDVDEPDIPVVEEMEENTEGYDEKDSDEDPIIDTAQ